MPYKLIEKRRLNDLNILIESDNDMHNNYRTWFVRD